MSTSTPQPTRTVDIITMGCSKNLVDSEQLLNLFNEHGFQVYHNPDTPLTIGEFYNVRINDCEGFDLYGTIA